MSVASPPSAFNPATALAGLRALAANRGRVVIVTHDNPDPDALASAAGLALLVSELTGLPTRLAYGGIVGRAENQAVARLLKGPLVQIHRVTFRADDLVALVDTQPAFGNHSLPPKVKADVVVDHHPAADGAEIALPILVNGVGATSTVIAELLREAGLEPSAELATALFYGVKTDTRSLSREGSVSDRNAYEWLLRLRDPALLAEIEHPRVPRGWFEVFHRAFERARVIDQVVIADIGDVYVPDVVPEVADRLMSLEGVRWSVALGVYEGTLFVSVRSSDGRVNAGKRLRRCLEDLGASAGGHHRLAAAQVPLSALPYREARKRVGEVVSRIKQELGVAEVEPEPLIDAVEATSRARRGTC